MFLVVVTEIFRRDGLVRFVYLFLLLSGSRPSPYMITPCERKKIFYLLEISIIITRKR